MTESFGEMLSVLRKRNRLSLTTFCALHGFDAGNLSRLESGKTRPPRPDKLKDYTAALGLEEGSEIWYELFDRAAAERGEFPADILDDPDLVDHIPTLFGILRGIAGSRRGSTRPQGTYG